MISGGLQSRFANLLVIVTFVLGILLFVFPTHFVYKYVPLQSISVFGSNFVYFVVLYYSWLALEFVLASGLVVRLSRNIILLFVLEFVFVQIGFWVIPTNLPIPTSDGTTWLAFLEVFARVHHLFGFSLNEVSYNSSWPAIALLTVALEKLMGVSMPVSMMATIFVVLLTTGVFAYFLFSELLGNDFYAFLASIVFFYASLNALNSVYTARIYPYVFFVGASWALARRIISGTTLRYTPLVIGLFLLAMAEGEFLVCAALASVILFLKIFYNDKIDNAMVAFAFVSLIIPTVLSAGALQNVAENALYLLHGGALIDKTFVLGKVVYNLPVWVSAVTVFWQILLSLPYLGSFAILLLYFKKKRTSPIFFVSVCMVGLTLYLLASAGGGLTYLVDILLFLPVYSIPFIISYSRKVNKTRNLGVLVLIMVFFSLALPTFVAYNRNQAIYKFYPQDTAGYSYIESLYPWGEMGKVLASYQTVPLPFLELNTTAIAFDPSSLPSSSALWSNWNFLLEELGNQASGNVLLFSERAVIPTASLLGIPPTDPKWRALMDNFTRFDRVYDNNGFLVLT